MKKYILLFLPVLFLSSGQKYESEQYRPKPKKIVKMPEGLSAGDELKIYQGGDGHDYYISPSHGEDSWTHYIECSKCKKNGKV